MTMTQAIEAQAETGSTAYDGQFHPSWEEQIQRNERTRLAALIEDNAELIGGYASDGVAAVRLVAMLVSLNSDP